jgi:hypothetical protein
MIDGEFQPLPEDIGWNVFSLDRDNDRCGRERRGICG